MQLAKTFSQAPAGSRVRLEKQPRTEHVRAPREVLALPKRRSDRNAGVPAPNYNEGAIDNVRETSNSAHLLERHGAFSSFAADQINNKRRGPQGQACTAPCMSHQLP